MTTLDSMDLEILRHKTTAAAEEMGLTLIRAARTIYVKEVADFAVAIGGLDGKAFAYPEALGVSAFVDLDLTTCLNAVGELEEGDVILSNSPYTNGGLSTHLPDLQLIKPYFHAGRIVAYGWTMAHTSDIGGGVPSSISPRFSELYQEGLQIPPVKLLARGAMDRSVLAIYLANCRSPETNLGDIKAMLAALDAGGKRIADIIAAHGVERLVAYQTRIAEYAAEKAAAIFARIPKGTHEFWDYLDHDFVSNVPVRFRCALTVDDTGLHLDFAGTDPQLLSAFNLPTAGLRSPYLTLRLLHMITSMDPSAPLNHGLLTGVSTTAPKGSIVNPEYPAACGVRHATAMRLIDLLSGVLHTADPGLVPAAGGGTVLPVVLADLDPVTGARRSMVIQSIVCGGGGRQGSDGVDGRESGLSNIRNSPIERTEDEAAVLVEHYGLRPDSGGPGRWRGGTGLVYTIRMLKEDCAVLARGLERFVFTPWGSAGGRSAPPCRVVLNIGTPQERDINRVDMLELRKGETITFMTPGGGGFGDPFDRSEDEVVHDVLRGLVTVEGARRDYGVVTTQDGEVDGEATARLRAARPARSMSGFDLGPVRNAWESVFDDASVRRINAALEALPATSRSRRKKAVYEQVIPSLSDDKPDLAAVLADPAGPRARLDAVLNDLEHGAPTR